MNMRILLLGLLIMVMSASTFGAGSIGTPTAQLKQNQWSLGFNYAYISTNLETNMYSIPGITAFKMEFNDNNIHRYYGTIGYGLTDSWDVYVQLGVADVKQKTVNTKQPAQGSFGWNYDNDFAWGWGTRYTFLEKDNIRLGASVQMNWLDTNWDDATASNEIHYDYETTDTLIAVGPTIDMGSWSLYGGPFYYCLSGELNGERATPVYSSVNLENNGCFGGFVGAQVKAMENYDITTDLSFTSDGWSISAGISRKF